MENIFQACCFLLSESLHFCCRVCRRIEAVSVWRTQRTAGEMRKYKVQVFLFKPQRLLEIQIAEAEE